MHEALSPEMPLVKATSTVVCYYCWCLWLLFDSGNPAMGPCNDSPWPFSKLQPVPWWRSLSTYLIHCNSEPFHFKWPINSLRVGFHRCRREQCLWESDCIQTHKQNNLCDSAHWRNSTCVQVIIYMEINMDKWKKNALLHDESIFHRNGDQEKRDKEHPYSTYILHL